MIENKSSYAKYKSDHLPIWCQEWYLQAICGDRWDCRFIVQSDSVVAIWIFGLTKKVGFKSINFPTFLKYNGLFFSDSINEEKYEDLGIKLMESLPYGIKMSTEFYPGIHTKLDKVITTFKERAFAQKLRQTFVWDVSIGPEALLKGMDGNYRRMINKQKDNVSIMSVSKEEAMDLYDFHTEWVDDLINHGVSKSQFKHTVHALYEREAGEVINLMAEGKKVASVCLLYDKKRVYYLLAVNNKEYKKIYPAVLMAYEVAKYICEKGREKIDFLGSDIEAISRIWRKLGATKEEYMYMNKSLILPFK